MALGSGIRDPRSGKNLFRIPDPGVKKAPDPDPQHCCQDPDLAILNVRNGNIVNLDVSGLKVHFQKSCLSVLSDYSAQLSYDLRK